MSKKTKSSKNSFKNFRKIASGTATQLNQAATSRGVTTTNNSNWWFSGSNIQLAPCEITFTGVKLCWGCREFNDGRSLVTLQVLCSSIEENVSELPLVEGASFCNNKCIKSFIKDSLPSIMVKHILSGCVPGEGGHTRIVGLETWDSLSDSTSYDPNLQSLFIGNRSNNSTWSQLWASNPNSYNGSGTDTDFRITTISTKGRNKITTSCVGCKEKGHQRFRLVSDSFPGAFKSFCSVECVVKAYS